MVGSNLPDDVTPGDIDKHFGAPEKRTVHGTVEVAVTIETQFFDEPRDCKKELLKAAEKGDIEQVLHAHIEEIE